MNVVGLLEADIQGSTEYRAGGIGPFFTQSRLEGPFPLEELIARSLRALRRAGVTEAVSLFVDEAEAFRGDDDSGADSLDAVLASARETAEGLEGGTSFYLMLTFDDDHFEHVITVEGAVDHPSDEAGMTILDTARPIDEKAGVFDEDTDIDLDAPDNEELIEQFLDKLLQAFDKELALSDPELEVWTDWDGEYDREQLGTPAISVPGYAGPQL
jgi:hypothetical protein